MENLLTQMIEKISEIEQQGIYIEDLHIEDRYHFDDEKCVSLTGHPRPAGEYYIVHLSVMVATAPQKTISTIDDVFNTAKSAIQQMPKRPGILKKPSSLRAISGQLSVETQHTKGQSKKANN